MAGRVNEGGEKNKKTASESHKNVTAAEGRRADEGGESEERDTNKPVDPLDSRPVLDI